MAGVICHQQYKQKRSHTNAHILLYEMCIFPSSFSKSAHFMMFQCSHTPFFSVLPQRSTTKFMLIFLLSHTHSPSVPCWEYCCFPFVGVSPPFLTASSPSVITFFEGLSTAPSSGLEEYDVTCADYSHFFVASETNRKHSLATSLSTSVRLIVNTNIWSVSQTAAARLGV